MDGSRKCCKGLNVMDAMYTMFSCNGCTSPAALIMRLVNGTFSKDILVIH